MTEELRLALEADEEQFVENLIARRQALGLTQTDLARKMQEAGWKNYTQMTVSRTEKRERQLSVAEARAIASLLDSNLALMMRPPREHLLVEALAGSVAELRAAARRVESGYRAIDSTSAQARHFLDRYSDERQSLPSDLAEIGDKLAANLEELVEALSRGDFWIEDHDGEHQETS